MSNILIKNIKLIFHWSVDPNPLPPTQCHVQLQYLQQQAHVNSDHALTC